MIAKFALATFGICIFIGILTIAIFVAGAILGVVLTVLLPVALIFTGLGVLLFLAKDYSPEDKTKSK